MRPLTLFLCSLLTVNATGQNWLKGLGGAGNDEALDVTAIQSGMIVSGFYSYGVDFDGNALGSAGQVDAFVAETDQTGNVIWAKQFGGTGADAAYANGVDAAGNIFVSGYYNGSMTVDGTTLTSNSNSQDVFLAKLDPTGNLLWIIDFGGFDHDFVYDLAVDSDGDVVITGNFKGTVTIGPNTYSSVIDPIQNEPSYDLFIAKYDTDGNFIWSKHGQAIYEDRGTGLAINSNDEIALIGQFSDTLTLDNVYPNQVYNTGFVMMFDGDGDELWMRKMSASMCIPYDIVFHQDSLMYITGDFTGQLAIFTNPLVVTTSPFQSKVFLTKMNTQGDVLWLRNDGSDSQVSSRAVEVDASGNAYISGYFRCRMDEYSQGYGEGVFYSAGRRDVFIANYNSSGDRVWERQFGGPGDDVAWDMILKNGNQPVISGAYSKFFHAPNGGNFLSTGWNTTSNLYLPNSPGLDYCSDTDYGAFATIESTGHQDILLAKPLDLSRQPYDFFSRSGQNCVRDMIPTCINGNCLDTIESCEPVLLQSVEYTGTNGYIGPSYNYTWSTGDNDSQISAPSTGNYWLRVDRTDGCYSYSDTVHVIVHPTPTQPHISDDFIVNTEAFSTERIFACHPDTIQLVMGNVDTINNYFGWGPGEGLITHTALDTTVVSSGEYFASHISPGGCENVNSVLVLIDDWANQDTLDPHILVGTGPNDLSATSDTIFACLEQDIYYLSIDSNNYQNVGLSMPYCSSDWNITFSNPALNDQTHFDWFPNEGGDLASWMMGHHFEALQSTWVYLDVEITDHCNGDTSTYFLHHEFYLHVSGFSAVEYGPHRMCPGDTIEIGIVGGDSFSWVTQSGALFTGSGTDDHIFVVGEGTYQWTASILTPSGGTCQETDTFRVRNLEAPDITMIPSHGIICPNDSVQMIAPAGSGYIWIGPNNAVIDSTQSIYASTPGFYYCQMTNPDGCFLISNEVEVRGFNTPYMSAEPQQTICEGGTVTLTVFANEGSILDWPEPLVDGVFEQDIYQAGYYEVAATFCGITDTVSITVFDVSPEVDLNIAGFDTICDGEALQVNGPPGYYSYEWSNGSQEVNIEVTEPGIYYLTAENFEGCIGHSDTLTVEVLPTPDAPTVSDTTVCFGGDAILHVVNQTDTVYWFNQYLEPLGASSTLSSDSVLAAEYWLGAHFNGECFSQYDTAWVNLFPETAPPQIFGQTTLCPNDSIYLYTDSSSVLQYTWTLPDQSEISGHFYASALPDSGTYVLTAEHPFCGTQSSEEFVQLVQSDAYTIDIILGDTLNCIGETVIITVDGDFAEMEWLPIQSNTNPLQVQIDTEVYASVVDLNGCEITTDSIEIQFQIPPASQTISAETICAGNTASLFISTPYDLILDDGQSLEQTNNPFETETLNSDTVYTFYFEDDIGCLSNQMTWEVDVIQLPETLAIGGDTLLCQGQELYLTASPSSTGSITFYDGLDNELGTASAGGELVLPDVSIINTSGGVYAVLTINGCSIESDFMQINAAPVPDAPELIQVGIGCPNDTVLVFAADTTGLEATWSGPNGFSSTEHLLVFDPIEPSEQGIYILQVQQSICSSDTSSIEISIAPEPEVELIPDTVICIGDLIDLQLDQSYNEMLWSTGGLGEVITVGDSGIYWVLVTNEFGCSDSDTTMVETLTCEVSAPNIITPNGDGLNDVFTFNLPGIETVHVQIFNRFGRLIYQWNTVDGAWDGTIQNNGFDVNEGTYFFVGSYMDISGTQGVRKGFIQVLR